MALLLFKDEMGVQALDLLDGTRFGNVFRDTNAGDPYAAFPTLAGVAAVLLGYI
jgi:hypothetical protein